MLLIVNVHGWTGGWSPAGRFLLPIAPLLWPAVYLYWAHASRVGRATASAFVAVQIAIDAFVWQFPKTLWNDGDGVTAAPFAAWLPSWYVDTASAFLTALGLSALFVVLCSRWIDRRAPVPGRH